MSVIWYDLSMRIVYIHHAHRDMSKGKTQENSITDYGAKEAAILGEVLREVKVKTIYSGDYIRYNQTVELINKYIKVPVVVDSRLNEWVGGTESKESLKNRTHEFLKEIISKYDDEDMVLCVTSGVNLSEFVTFFYKAKPIKGFQFMQAAGICPIVFEYQRDEV